MLLGLSGKFTSSCVLVLFFELLKSYRAYLKSNVKVDFIDNFSVYVH
jgi:hypothetical protein